MAPTPRDVSRQWGWLAARGVFAIIFGILAFVWPGMALLTLVVLYGFYALVDGIAALLFAARGGKSAGGRTWPLVLTGIAGLAAGVITFVWPGITAIALLYVIAFWALVRGVMEFVAAFRLHESTGVSVMLGTAGVLSVGFGILLLALPAAGIMALVWLVALYAIIVGVVSLIVGLQMRSAIREARPPRPQAGTPVGPTPA